MKQPIMEYMAHMECSCGFLKYGNVKDDPSCVRETASDELRKWVKNHLTTCRFIGTYLAYVVPIK